MDNEARGRVKRYANNPYVCWGTENFEAYRDEARSERYEKTGMKHEKAKTMSELKK